MMLSRAIAPARNVDPVGTGASRWRVVRQLLIESVLSARSAARWDGLASAGIHWFDLSTRDVGASWIEFTMDCAVFGYFAASAF